MYEGKAADGAARKEVERAFQLSPNDMNVLLARAELLNDRELACRYARTAHQMDPLNLDGFLPFVNCLFDEQKYDEAIAETRKAVELYPRFPGLHDLLSGFYQRRGRYPEAIAEIERYRALGGLCPEEALIHAWGGRAPTRSGDEIEQTAEWAGLERLVRSDRLRWLGAERGRHPRTAERL